MKKLLLPVLACGMFVSAYPQNDPVEPCCSIVNMNTSTNAVTVRDKTTGRLYQFKADALDMKAVKLNDGVNVSSGKVSSISGAKRAYATVRPDYGEPCCNVVSIQVDGVEPCCAVALIKNNTTNKSFQVSIPKAIAATLKTGQAVSFDAATNLAIVQSNNSGGMAFYGYPVESGESSSGEGTSSDKWVITANNLKGSTGRILMDNPAGSIWVVYIYAMADNKYITSFAESNNKGLFVIPPGEYKFTINNAPVLNVPVKKGHDTKLKCGILDIVSEGIWYLNDETGKTYYTSGDKPQKMPLPVGTYSLKFGEASQTVIIKEGESVEM